MTLLLNSQTGFDKMVKKLWYLVEDFSYDIDYTTGKVLALTPEASYCFDKTGKKYYIIEDFYNEKELIQSDDLYFYEQLSWFEKFDQFLKKNISYCKKEDIALARAHSHRLKFFVDSVIIHSYIFTKFFENAKPDRILYVCKKENGSLDFSIYMPYGRQHKIILPLVKKICDEKGIPCLLKTDGYNRSQPTISPSFKVSIKESLKKCHFKSLIHFFKYTKYAKFFSAKKYQNLNILSLHAGCISMDSLIKDLISSGSKVFLKTDDKKITSISGIFEKKVLDLSLLAESPNELKIRKDCKKAYEKFIQEKELISWVSNKCGFDASDILAPYFKDFIENICSENLIETPILKDFYKREKIDFVVTRSSSEQVPISSLLAAANSRKRVCFQHACGAFDNRREHISELVLFDYYFAMHDDAQEHMNLNLKNDYVGSCKVYQAPYHIQAVGRKWGKVRRDKNLVMYIPTKLFFGFRSYNGYLYPLTWYFKLQKSLIDFFSTKKNLRFIFKYAPGQEWSANSVLLYIKDKNCSNISIESKPVSECLGKAGRVILDFPSTSLYEAAAAKIPVMSLYHELLEIRDPALKLFGKSLQKFSGVSNAIEIVDDFLDTDPEEFKVNIPVSNDSTLDILEKIKEENIYAKKD